MIQAQDIENALAANLKSADAAFSMRDLRDAFFEAMPKEASRDLNYDAFIDGMALQKGTDLQSLLRLHVDALEPSEECPFFEIVMGLVCIQEEVLDVSLELCKARPLLIGPFLSAVSSVFVPMVDPSGTFPLLIGDEAFSRLFKPLNAFLEELDCMDEVAKILARSEGVLERICRFWMNIEAASLLDLCVPHASAATLEIVFRDQVGGIVEFLEEPGVPLQMRTKFRYEFIETRIRSVDVHMLRVLGSLCRYCPSLLPEISRRTDWHSNFSLVTEKLEKAGRYDWDFSTEPTAVHSAALLYFVSGRSFGLNESHRSLGFGDDRINGAYRELIQRCFFSDCVGIVASAVQAFVELLEGGEWGVLELAETGQYKVTFTTLLQLIFVHKDDHVLQSDKINALSQMLRLLHIFYTHHRTDLLEKLAPQPGDPPIPKTETEDAIVPEQVLLSIIQETANWRLKISASKILTVIPFPIFSPLQVGPLIRTLSYLSVKREPGWNFVQSHLLYVLFRLGVSFGLKNAASVQVFVSNYVSETFSEVFQLLSSISDGESSEKFHDWPLDGARCRFALEKACVKVLQVAWKVGGAFPLPMDDLSSEGRNVVSCCVRKLLYAESASSLKEPTFIEQTMAGNDVSMLLDLIGTVKGPVQFRVMHQIAEIVAGGKRTEILDTLSAMSFDEWIQAPSGRLVEACEGIEKRSLDLEHCFDYEIVPIDISADSVEKVASCQLYVWRQRMKRLGLDHSFVNESVSKQSKVFKSRVEKWRSLLNQTENVHYMILKKDKCLAFCGGGPISTESVSGMCRVYDICVSEECDDVAVKRLLLQLCWRLWTLGYSKASAWMPVAFREYGLLAECFSIVSGGIAPPFPLPVDGSQFPQHEFAWNLRGEDGSMSVEMEQALSEAHFQQRAFLRENGISRMISLFSVRNQSLTRKAKDDMLHCVRILEKGPQKVKETQSLEERLETAFKCESTHSTLPLDVPLTGSFKENLIGAVSPLPYQSPMSSLHSIEPLSSAFLRILYALCTSDDVIVRTAALRKLCDPLILSDLLEWSVSVLHSNPLTTHYHNSTCKTLKLVALVLDAIDSFPPLHQMELLESAVQFAVAVVSVFSDTVRNRSLGAIRVDAVSEFSASNAAFLLDLSMKRLCAIAFIKTCPQINRKLIHTAITSMFTQDAIDNCIRLIHYDLEVSATARTNPVELIYTETTSLSHFISERTVLMDPTQNHSLSFVQRIRKHLSSFFRAFVRLGHPLQFHILTQLKSSQISDADTGNPSILQGILRRCRNTTVYAYHCDSSFQSTGDALKYTLEWTNSQLELKGTVKSVIVSYQDVFFVSKSIGDESINLAFLSNGKTVRIRILSCELTGDIAYSLVQCGRRRFPFLQVKTGDMSCLAHVLRLDRMSSSNVSVVLVSPVAMVQSDGLGIRRSLLLWVSQEDHHYMLCVPEKKVDVWIFKRETVIERRLDDLIKTEIVRNPNAMVLFHFKNSTERLRLLFASDYSMETWLDAIRIVIFKGSKYTVKNMCRILY